MATLDHLVKEMVGFWWMVLVTGLCKSATSLTVHANLAWWSSNCGAWLLRPVPGTWISIEVLYCMLHGMAWYSVTLYGRMIENSSSNTCCIGVWHMHCCMICDVAALITWLVFLQLITGTVSYNWLHGHSLTVDYIDPVSIAAAVMLNPGMMGALFGSAILYIANILPSLHHDMLVPYTVWRCRTGGLTWCWIITWTLSSFCAYASQKWCGVYSIAALTCEGWCAQLQQRVWHFKLTLQCIFSRWLQHY